MPRIPEVQPPAGQRARGHHERGGLRPQHREQGVDLDPDAGHERGQPVGQRGTAAGRSGQRAQAPDRLDPAELVLGHAPQPPLPQCPQGLVGRLGQHRLPARSARACPGHACRAAGSGWSPPGTEPARPPAAASARRTPRWAPGATAIGAVVVVPGDENILDQPDRRGQRAPGGRAAAHLPVGGQLEDGDQVRQRVRAGTADGDRPAGKGRGAQEGRAGPAALGIRGPLTSDTDRALGHQETLTVSARSGGSLAGERAGNAAGMCHGGGMRVTGVDACRGGWVAVSLPNWARSGWRWFACTRSTPSWRSAPWRAHRWRTASTPRPAASGVVSC